MSDEIPTGSEPVDLTDESAIPEPPYQSDLEAGDESPARDETPDEFTTGQSDASESSGDEFNTAFEDPYSADRPYGYYPRAREMRAEWKTSVDQADDEPAGAGLSPDTQQEQPDQPDQPRLFHRHAVEDDAPQPASVPDATYPVDEGSDQPQDTWRGFSQPPFADAPQPAPPSDEVPRFDFGAVPPPPSTDMYPPHVEQPTPTPMDAVPPHGTDESVRVSASIYRDDPYAQEPQPGIVEVDNPVIPSETVIMPTEDLSGERRAARARALGEVDPGADVITAPPRLTAPSVYKWWPSLTLFLFRLILAGIVSVRATQQILDFTATKQVWANSMLTSPALMAGLEIAIEYIIALMLVLGIGSRIAGALIMVLYITILCFLVWGAANPFQRGVLGFAGEFELLMTASGLVLLGIGGGRIAIDGVIHKNRLEKKNARLVG